MKPRVTHVRSHNAFSLYVNGTLHLRFALEEFVGFQSWLWTHPRPTFSRGIPDRDSYEMEFYFSHGATIKTTYDDRSLWEEILKLLDKEL